MPASIRSRTHSCLAALLLVASIAACADVPTSAVLEAKTTRPALDNPAPQLSLSYDSGGHPLLSWSALTGALSYDVVLEVGANSGNWQTAETSSWTTDSPQGSTTGTSFLATNLSYTGTWECFATFGYEWYHWIYRFRVTATFTDGTSSSYIEAPVVTC